MRLPSSLIASVDRARARVDALHASLDRLSAEAEDLAFRRGRFLEEGEELLSRIALLEENDVSARSRLLEEYRQLAARLEAHCRLLVEAGQSYRSSVRKSSSSADAGKAAERYFSLSLRSEAVKATLRRMQEGPAARNNRRNAR